MRGIFKKIVQRLDFFIFSRVAWIAVKVIKKSTNAPVSGRPILIPSSGKGNIGDEAILQSILQFFDCEVSVVIDSPLSYSSYFENEGVSKLTPFWNVFDGNGLSNYLNLWKLIWMCSSARVVVMIGADILTGKYSKAAALRRLYFVNSLSELEINVQISPSSYHDIFDKELATLLLKFGQNQSIWVRDKESSNQLMNIGQAKIIYSADVAFGLEGFEVYSGFEKWSKYQKLNSMKIAIYNISGLQLQNHVVLRHHSELAEILIESGFSIVLLPHVFRAGDDDFAACFTFFEALPTRLKERVFFVNLKPNPRQIRYLISKSDLVIGARMHLLIAACSQKIPVISTCDDLKFVELLREFGLSDNLFNLNNLNPSFEKLITQKNLVEAKSKIELHLPLVLSRLEEFSTQLRAKL